jgi:predicted nucleic acid-binding protein
MEQLLLYTEQRYVIDTSSVVDVRYADDPAKVWAALCRLIDNGKLLTVSYVFPELKRMVADDKLPKEVFEQLKVRKRAMVIPDAKIIHEAGRINHKYPRLGDWRDVRNRADPWIVAAGKAGKHIVVTEERDTGPRKTHRIPWVCDQEGVRWIRVDRLISSENLMASDEQAAAST